MLGTVLVVKRLCLLDKGLKGPKGDQKGYSYKDYLLVPFLPFSAPWYQTQLSTSREAHHTFQFSVFSFHFKYTRHPEEGLKIIRNE